MIKETHTHTYVGLISSTGRYVQSEKKEKTKSKVERRVCAISKHATKTATPETIKYIYIYFLDREATGPSRQPSRRGKNKAADISIQWPRD